MRIYLSGARRFFDGSEFCRVSEILREFGHVAVSPDLFNRDKNQSWASNAALIYECDAVAMLDGWEDCKACKLEASYSDFIGIQCSGWRDYVEVVA